MSFWKDDETNLWRKVEAIFKPWMLVLAFLLVLLFAFHKEARAESVVSVELGPTFLSGEFSKSGMLILNQTWDDHWRIGMGVSGEQRVVPRREPETVVRANLFVHGQRVVALGEHFDLGIGVGYFNAKTRWNGSNFVASLSVEYSFSDRWGINYRHWSNAGSASPNMGQDVFTVRYSFR